MAERYEIVAPAQREVEIFTNGEGVSLVHPAEYMGVPPEDNSQSVDVPWSAVPTLISKLRLMLREQRQSERAAKAGKQ